MISLQAFTPDLAAMGSTEGWWGGLACSRAWIRDPKPGREAALLA